MAIQIFQESKDQTVNILQKALATNYVLYTKLNNFHWNTTGIHFLDLHSYFGDLYDAMGEDIDLIAERIRALDSKPLSTMKEFLDNSAIKEQPSRDLTEIEMITELVSDYQTIANYLYSNSSKCDKVTDNMFLTVIEAIQKNLWKLKSLLK